MTGQKREKEEERKDTQREREREKERDRERQTDRQTEKQTEKREPADTEYHFTKAKELFSQYKVYKFRSQFIS